MDKREFKNRFAEMPEDFTLDSKLKATFESSIQEYLGYIENPDEFARYLRIKNDFDDSRGDFSVYTGECGIAYMYYRLGDLGKAKSLIKPWLKRLKGRRVTFLCGDAGPLALASIIYFKEGNLEKHQYYLNKLLQLKTKVLDKNSDMPDELLYGRAGYLFSLLLVNKECEESSVETTLIRQIVEVILRSGHHYSRKYKCSSPLMYEWHDKRYYGAAHGLAGIYATLLQTNVLQENEIEDLVKPSVDYLLGKAFPSGNFPSSEGSDRDRLVHWCHGAPGIVHLLLLCYTKWGDKKYQDAALKCGDVIWSRGLLRKGEGLCHGTGGNGYAFLHLYQVTQEKEWLYRAAMFAVHCTQINKHFVNLADRPLSLFEGLSGAVCFLNDILQPENAKFPAFIL
eukprot:TRINITY_DN8799_c0_g1_i2.p1 TRINITY_DN8799_c0_g1~~TRINITY_DN8799_c0_g1_i2.p1  ORF type:complete len:413 (-),score=53.50 TRINITY_DN8799_c0_g1_i2:122-1309(-)